MTLVYANIAISRQLLRFNSLKKIFLRFIGLKGLKMVWKKSSLIWNFFPWFWLKNPCFSLISLTGKSLQKFPWIPWFPWSVGTLPSRIWRLRVNATCEQVFTSFNFAQTKQGEFLNLRSSHTERQRKRFLWCFAIFFFVSSLSLWFGVNRHLRSVYTYRLRLHIRLCLCQILTLCQWKRTVWRTEWVQH